MDEPIEAPIPMPDPPDVMNDPEFAPPQRRDTASSKYGSEGGGETCRICRSEGTPEEPLFYPCKCNGSIKFVHQECLMEWLSHSHKKHCELCKTPFRFTKLYDANMPKTLPWTVFVRRACIQVFSLLLRACRATLVGWVWLVVLPWLIRWGWRWMFWFADAGWARESFLRDVRAEWAASQVPGPSNATTKASDSLDSIFALFETMWERRLATSSGMVEENSTMIKSAGELSSTLDNTTWWRTTSPSNATFPPTPGIFGADTSILSSWTYLSQLTSKPNINRRILDVFEGQLITCVVITGFILVFLIREWVVQQQPLVNLDMLDHERERDRLERETERLRRQVELLDQARARLVTLQEEAELSGAGDDQTDADNSIEQEEFIGLEQLVLRIDETNALLRGPNAENNLEIFKASAHELIRQMHIAEKAGVSITEMVERVYQQIKIFTEDERSEWEDVMIATLELLSKKKTAKKSRPDQSAASEAQEIGTTAEGAETTRRPPMPSRDASFLATEVYRSLADTDGDTDRARIDGGLSDTHSQAVHDPQEAQSGDSSSVPEAATKQAPLVDHSDIFQDNNDEMPITNAGPDAKTNIRRSGKVQRSPVVPEPEDNPNSITENELIRRLDDSPVAESNHPGNDAALLAAATPTLPAMDQNVEPAHNNNPFHPDGPEPEHPEPESLRDRVASVFREEFGLEQAEDTELIRQAGFGPDDEAVPNGNGVPETSQDHRPEGPPPSVLQRLADYFWGDIQPPGVPEPAIAPAEERVGDVEDVQEAPFVPVQNGIPAIDAVPHDPANDAVPNDPEVVAAAQQAGLDAEAIEDAEDLEGILELIGFQGPLIGLFQTSCFCTVLVIGTVAGAVGIPYLWGKLILSFLSAPLTLLVKLPLKFASSFADIVIDIGLALGGWLMFFFARGNATLLSWLERWVPTMGLLGPLRFVCKFAETTASNAGYRLLDLFVSSTEPEAGIHRSWNWVFLSGSVHSHASLKTIQHTVDSILNYTGHRITDVAEALSSGTASGVWTWSVDAISQIPEIPAKLSIGSAAMWDYWEALMQQTMPVVRALASLKTGALTFKSSTVQMDPALVYWSITDRSLAVLTGYLSLAVFAAIYVAVDTPITSSQSGQRTEKMIRDTLRQAGGVLKVILIISIEMLAFPLYCGLLLDFAFLPLFRHDTVATRWAFAVRAPSTFCFIHWFVGTCYMFHFALFVGMCRKILRKGVLWFIRDPDDPTFHPVRDVLERNVTTQLRKIAFSALVYGALVILCLGGVIWSIGRIFKGIFPIQWISTEPVLEFPMDLLLYNFLTPLLIKLFKPSDVVNTMYAWWLRRCARVLRLSHFLFDDRRKDEEGRHVRKSWASFLLLRRAEVGDGPAAANRLLTQDGQLPEVYFKRDGKYVLTPCNDQYRPPKAGEAFLHSDDNDVYIADKEGKKNDHFAKIYVPPFFRLRVTLFMVCLWLFSAFTGLCATLVPLVFGRQIFASIVPDNVQVNDIYAYSLGAYILTAVAFVIFKGTTGARYLRDKAQSVDIKAWAGATTRFSAQALKCIYVYGFLGVVLPLLFAMFLQFYLTLPLHTYLVSSLGPTVANNTNLPANITVGHASPSNESDPISSLAQSFANYATNLTSTTNATLLQSDRLPVLADHSIHILADYALGLLYVRIAIRLILTAPTSRAAQAFRLITANGYLNPNVRLATRYFVLPTTLLSIVVLLAPLWLAKAVMAAVRFLNDHFPKTAVAWELDEQVRTLFYRYSYPAAAGCAVLLAGTVETGKILGRWRASVRDEVYLVGERLHNFGEGKPPVGSRSVVRKER